MTKLAELVQQLDALDADGTIYALEPWSEASEAIVADEPISGGLPAEAQRRGLKYLLEVSIARDVISEWIASLDAPPTISQQCTRLIHYAIYDA